MDLVGEIVEHDKNDPRAPEPLYPEGFPDLKLLHRKKASRFRKTKNPEPAKKADDNKSLSESDKINEENIKKLNNMSIDDIVRERDEIMNSLDLKVIQGLLRRAEKRSGSNGDHDGHVHAEGYDGWIGGSKYGKQLPRLEEDDVNKALGITSPSGADANATTSKPERKGLKTARFKEGADLEEYFDEKSERLADDGAGPHAMEKERESKNENNDESEVSDVHFPKPLASPENDDIDLYDPKFFDKLHQKYYPDLPKETHKLAWMAEPMPSKVGNAYESIADLRFDFKGNIVELNENSREGENDVPTTLGLHHHSQSPQRPGYTLAELAHLSRSTFPSQRCISIQTLGRILHKLGLHKYTILPSEENIDQEFKNNLEELSSLFENYLWELAEELRIIDSLVDAASERTRHVSVRNYAIEALWLWKQADQRGKEKEKEKLK